MNRLKLCACAVAWLVVVGFTPAAPASETIAGYWPRTCEEAIDILAAVLPAGSKAELRTTARSGLVPLNDDLGKQIRTNFGLYRGNVELMASCAARAGATRKHPGQHVAGDHRRRVGRDPGELNGRSTGTRRRKKSPRGGRANS